MYNIFAYIIYLLLTFYITIYVGYKVHQLGFIFLKNLVENITVCKSINNILLIGYYLVNLGFCAFNLNSWNTIKNINQMLNTITYNVGTILVILGILHFINLFIIYIKSKNNFK